MATKPRKGVCKDCKERILWVKTIKGNNMAVDIDPQICAFEIPGPYYHDEKGDLNKGVIVFKGKLGVVVNGGELFTAHRCHFDTCSAKAKWDNKAEHGHAGVQTGETSW